MKGVALAVMALGLLSVLAACGGTSPAPSAPPPGASAQSVTLLGSGSPAPTAVAGQVGSGPWTALSAHASGDYTLSVSGGSYGLAVFCQGAASRRFYVQQLTTAEATQLPNPCASPEAVTKVTIGYNLTGTPAAVGDTIEFEVVGPSLSAGGTATLSALSGTLTLSSTVSGVVSSAPENLDVLVTDLSKSEVLGAQLLAGQTVAADTALQVSSLSPVQTVSDPPLAGLSALIPTPPSLGDSSATYEEVVDNQGTFLPLPIFQSSACGSAESSCSPSSQTFQPDQITVSGATYVGELSRTEASTPSSGTALTSIQGWVTSSPQPSPPASLPASSGLPPMWPLSYSPQGATYPDFNLGKQAVYAVLAQPSSQTTPPTSVYAEVSSGWLGSSTSYTLPALGSVPGFSAWPSAASATAVSALKLNTSLANLLASGEQSSITPAIGYLDTWTSTDTSAPLALRSLGSAAPAFLQLFRR